MIISFLR